MEMSFSTPGRTLNTTWQQEIFLVRFAQRSLWLSYEPES